MEQPPKQQCPLKQRINKQVQVLNNENRKFYNFYQGKYLQTQKIQNYCSYVTYLSSLQSTLMENCVEYMTPRMKDEIFKTKDRLIKDLVQKMRCFKNQKQKYEKGQIKPELLKQICHICDTKIREIDIGTLKQQLSDDASLRKTLMKKLYKDLDNENAQLFSRQEDQVFFRFLNRVLIKKEQLLSMQTKQISDFLIQVTHSFSSLNHFADYSPSNSNGFQAGYTKMTTEDMSKSLSKSLKANFENKIPPWIHTIIEKMTALIQKKRLSKMVQESCQTTQENLFTNTAKKSNYMNTSIQRKQIQQLKKENIQLKEIIQGLNKKIPILQKQKLQTQQYWQEQYNKVIKQQRQLKQQIKELTKQNYEKQSKMKLLRKNTNKKAQVQQKSILNEQPTIKSIVHIQEDINIDETTTPAIQSRTLLTTTRKKKKPKNLLMKTTNPKNYQQPKGFTFQHQRGISNFTNQFESKVQGQYDTLEGNEVGQMKSAQDFLSKLNSKRSKNGEKSKRTSKSKQKEQNNKLKQNSSKLLQDDTKRSKNVEFNQNNSILYSEALQQQDGQYNKSDQNIKSKVGKKNIKRMVSIQHKVVPILTKNKASNESFYKSNNKNSSMSKQNIGSKKNTYQIAPPQDLEQYSNMKQRVNKITTILQLRNGQKIKTNLKNSLGSCKDIFKNGNGLSKILTKKGQIDRSFISKNGDIPVPVIDRQMQTQSLDNVQQKKQQKQQLFETLKYDNLIPKDLSYTYYELMVRKFFSQKKTINRQHTSPNRDENSRPQSPKTKQKRQHQSIKINIDASFLDNSNSMLKMNDLNLPKAKNLLNLPKLSHQHRTSRYSTNFLKTKSSSTLRQSSLKHQLSFLGKDKDINSNSTNNQLQTIKQRTASRQSTLITHVKNFNLPKNKDKKKQMQKQNCPILEQLFCQKDLKGLFYDQATAFQFQKYTKNNTHQVNIRNKSMSFKLTQIERQTMQNIYKMLSMIKAKNQNIYHKTCSFIRYPYQTVRNGFDFINIAKDMSEQSFRQYFNKICKLHSKCQRSSSSISNQENQHSNEQNIKYIGNNSKKSPVCSHIMQFGSKIAQLLVTANTNSNSNQYSQKQFQELQESNQH